jgi:hypothetical protein
VQHLLAPITQGQLNTWMHSGSVQGLNTAPHSVGGIAVESDPIRVFTGGVAKSHRGQIPWHITGMQGTAGE